MAISEDKNRLFTTVKDGKKIGISLEEIYSCLRYYKRDKSGKRNLSLPIQFGGINKWAKCKPFRFGQPNFASSKEKEDARKGSPNSSGESQGLLLPIVNKLVSMGDNPDRWTYLVAAAGSFMMNSGEAKRDYLYLRPRGIEKGEYFRLRDFDGYSHLNPQVKLWQCGMQGATAGQTIEINRFENPRLRFYMMSNIENERTLALTDIIQSSDRMRFVVEECDDTQNKPYYQWNKPSAIHVASEPAADADYAGQFIDVELDAANDNKQITFIMGINEINPDTMQPYEASGIGMFAPSENGAHYIYINQKNEINIKIAPLRFATGAATPSFIALPNYDASAAKTTSSDIIVEMKVQKTSGYYITSANFNGSLPANARNFKFRFRNSSSQTSFNDNVVAIVSNELGQTAQSIFIDRKESPEPNVVEYETIYLRFNNVMSASGVYTSGRLEASGDGGATWGTITSGNEGLTLYITKQ